MENGNRARRGRIGRIGRTLAWVAVVALPSQALAEALTQDDVSLALYTSPDGSSWSELGTSARAGFFGPHRCLCPATLMGLVKLATAGQTKLAQSQSSVTVSFLLGSSCASAPAGCASIGQVAFSASQTATPPSFSSNLVFQAVAGSTAVACGSLKVGATTLWAVLAQDGVALPFAPTLDLPVISKTVGAPTAVTAQPANEGLLVSWSAPSDSALVAGYQVLCSPSPTSAATAGYESCGLASSVDAGSLSPADTTQLCSGKLAAGTTSVRLEGLQNGVSYVVGVVAIDVSGGVSAMSPLASAIPQSTMGFYEKYKEAGGAATSCSLAPSGWRPTWLGCIGLAALAFLPLLRRRSRCSGPLSLLLALVALGGPVQAQDSEPSQSIESRDEPTAAPTAPAETDRQDSTHVPALPRADHDDWVEEPAAARGNDDWAAEHAPNQAGGPPEWAVELGLSWYRPAVDSELGGGARPYADTFSNSRHLLSEAELVRYVSHRYGAWGVGLRAGYYRVTAKAFLGDGATRSGDETALRLIPCALSLVYRAVGLPGLRRLPLTPYAKVGLDGVFWTASKTGKSASPSGLSLGWHVAGGLMLGLNFLGSGEIGPHGVADPLAIFFEWDYAAINGLGVSDALHVGDNTWFAGIMFDI